MMVNSKLKRQDIELENLFKYTRNERIRRNIDNEPISFRRWSKAVARLIDKNMDLKETLIKSALEDDRKFRRKK